MNYEEIKAAAGITDNTNIYSKSDFSPGMRVDEAMRHLLSSVEALEEEIRHHNDAIYDLYSEIRDLKEQ